MQTPTLPELDLVAESTSVWGSSLQPAGCRICRQVFLAASNQIGQICPNCAQSTLETQPARVRHEPPEMLVPFKKGRAEVQALLSLFVKDVWLKPDDFNTEMLLKRIRPIFWPMWLIDAEVSGDWQAEIGYDYQVKSVRESYASGGWATNDVIEDRIRWEPRMGLLHRRYENVPSPALEDHKALSILAGKYDLAQSQPYSEEGFRGSLLRLPDMPPETAWPMAQAAIKDAAAQECSQAAAGQHARNFAIHPQYSNLNWTLLLLPLYATYYTDDEGVRYPIIINGQTGVMGGIRLASQRKGWLWGGILGGIGLLLILLAVLLTILGTAFPPAALVGGIMALVGVIVAAAGLVPILWPWQWNRNQRSLRVARK